MPGRRSWSCSLIVLSILLCASHTRAARSGLQTLSTAEIEKLVKHAVWNEAQAAEHPAARFEYEETDTTPKGSTTTEQIETPAGVASRLLKVNGRAPGAARRAKDARRLHDLLRNPKAQHSLLQSQQAETQRRMNLLKEFPDAFRFQFEGVGSDGAVRLGFQPRPGYHPSSHEGLALEGMRGNLWIDRAEQRVVKIDGALFRPVSLGWGIAVRLYPGGHFRLEQSEVAKDRWRTTLLSVDLRGRILLVKRLDVHLRQTRRSFEAVPQNLTLAQAVRMLRGQGAETSRIPAKPATGRRTGR